jgi:predicted O-methyltransferase YrrM
LAALTSQKIYGFDSFQGLPEDWRTGFEKGAFAQGLPSVLSNVELIVGLFKDTLPDFLAQEGETSSISLIHIDCDLYGSTKDVLTECGPFLNKGTIIVFDEYFNYPGWQQNEFQAFQEHISTIGASYRYEAFVSRHQQVCVVLE